jgi:hypothetical protein
VADVGGLRFFSGTMRCVGSVAVPEECSSAREGGEVWKENARVGKKSFSAASIHLYARFCQAAGLITWTSRFCVRKHSLLLPRQRTSNGDSEGRLDFRCHGGVMYFKIKDFLQHNVPVVLGKAYQYLRWALDRHLFLAVWALRSLAYSLASLVR